MSIRSMRKTRKRIQDVGLFVAVANSVVKLVITLCELVKHLH